MRAATNEQVQSSQNSLLSLSTHCYINLKLLVRHVVIKHAAADKQASLCYQFSCCPLSCVTSYPLSLILLPAGPMVKLNWLFSHWLHFAARKKKALMSFAWHLGILDVKDSARWHEGSRNFPIMIPFVTVLQAGSKCWDVQWCETMKQWELSTSESKTCILILTRQYLNCSLVIDCDVLDFCRNFLPGAVKNILRMPSFSQQASK